MSAYARRPGPRAHYADPSAPHLKWAELIGRSVANQFKFRDQERDDLVSVAWLTLLELVRRTPADGGFDAARIPEGGDPVGAFRGWAYQWIKTACNREAERLRNGGTYHTKRPDGPPVYADPLGDAGGAILDDAAPQPDPRHAPPADPDPPADAVLPGRRFATRRCRLLAPAVSLAAG